MLQKTTFLLTLCLLLCGTFGLIQPTAAAVPGPISNGATTRGYENITAKWDAGEGATSHQIQWAPWNGSLTIPIETENFENHIITGLTNMQTYHVRVRSKNAEGFSKWRWLPDNTPNWKAPDQPPEDLMVTPDNEQLILSWTNSWTGTHGEATGAEVRYGISGTDSPPPDMYWVDTDDLESHTITGLTNDTEYYIQVRSKNVWGPGMFSEISGTPTDTPPDAAPTNLVAAVGNNKLTVSWTAVPRAMKSDMARVRPSPALGQLPTATPNTRSRG